MGSPTPVEHPLDGGFRLGAKFLVEGDLRGEVAQGVTELGNRVSFHVAAFITGAEVSGASDEGFFRDFTLQTMNHTTFRDDDEGLSWVVLAEVNHLFSAADLVCHVANGL
jgi:hypothetical protein